MKYKFEIDRSYVRGSRRGETDMITIDFPKRESIYGYLWDVSEKFEKNKLHFVVEHYVFCIIP